MCTNPLTIRNPKLSLTALDARYIDVPCGKCRQCADSKQQDWQVRLIAEFEKFRKHGCVFYYTLTFNEANLPRFCGKPCFSKRLIQLFKKRLSKSVKYRLGNDTTCKYFIVSEFGDNGRRPHHHMLSFLSRKIDPYTYRDLLLHAWPYGFNKPGDNHGLVDSSAAVSYVTKYVCKNLDGDDSLESWLRLHIHQCQQYLNKNHIQTSGIFKDVLRKTLHQVGRFTSSSEGLGLSIVDHLSKQDLQSQSVELPCQDRIAKRFPLPDYIKRKLYYNSYINKNGNVSYNLNKLGLSSEISKYDTNFYQFLKSAYRIAQCDKSRSLSALQFFHLSQFKNNFPSSSCTTDLRNFFEYMRYTKGLSISPKIHGKDLVSTLKFPVVYDNLVQLPNPRTKNFRKDRDLIQEYQSNNYSYIEKVYRNGLSAMRYFGYSDAVDRHNIRQEQLAVLHHTKPKYKKKLSYEEYICLT